MSDIALALVIDDDELVRSAVSRQLASLGVASVETAADGASARQALQSGRRYDLIVLDLLLPGADAVELLRDSARLHPGTALILISSMDERVLRTVAVLSSERGLRVLGALRKPLRMGALEELLQKRRPNPATATPGRTVVLPTAADLTLALQRRNISAQVQPKVMAADGRLHSVELLARWQDPRLGAVAPLTLVRLAEHSGQVAAFTEYMLGIALRSCAQWWQAGRQVPVSLNLSSGGLNRLDLPDLIQRQLRACELQPSMLIVEIGESSLLDDPLILDVLARLRLMGVRVSLDNFGASHGSLVRLQRLPITEVKIARSFIRCLPDSGTASTIVEFSVKMARALGLETVAVGVETEAQAQLLAGLGCEVLQGSHIAGPMDIDTLDQWSQQRPPVTAAAALEAAA
ncbi:MAG TPA: EAL domain-containing response regulator [Solimonas sp.]|nr:EAL domain-containing response regulator [Solimonas sp.]